MLAGGAIIGKATSEDTGGARIDEAAILPIREDPCHPWQKKQSRKARMDTDIFSCFSGLCLFRHRHFEISGPTLLESPRDAILVESEKQTQAQ